MEKTVAQAKVPVHLVRENKFGELSLVLQFNGLGKLDVNAFAVNDKYTVSMAVYHRSKLSVNLLFRS